MVIAIGLYVCLFNIIVTVENVGDQSIKNVRIEMSGKVYDLGEIESGESETEFTFPRADSGVKLVWTARGVVHEDWIGGYVTLGYGGRIGVDMNGPEVVGLSGSMANVQQ